MSINMRRHMGDALALVALTAASLYLTWNLFIFATDVKALLDLESQIRIHSPAQALDSYSWIGSDHPKRLPVEEKAVKMIVQESTHHSLTDPEAADEWLWTATVGDGHVRLGKDRRMFAVAMFHQLHCLRGIRNALEKGWKNIHPARQAHINHCYNYLRLWTLCSADVTLEPGDFATRNFTTERTGATHTCIDWLPSYEFMKERWFDWERYRVEHNIPDQDDAI